MYIGHGPKCKVYDGTEYAYSSASLDRHGRVVYTKMFARREDQRRAIADKPNLKDIVTVVGNLENDKVVANAGRREELRAQFGFAPDDVVVYVLSTWGEHCVWHTIGDGLLEQARTLPRDSSSFSARTPTNTWRNRDRNASGGNIFVPRSSTAF